MKKHNSYLATQRKEQWKYWCYIQFLSSKYKLHIRMFYHSLKTIKIKTFRSTKMSFLQMCAWAARVFPSLCVCVSGWSVKLSLMRKNKSSSWNVGLVSSQRRCQAEWSRILRIWPRLTPSIWFSLTSWTFLGRQPYMATLATCSSSRAIRRSWRMTRSLSDLNSRSTSSSLSSIFWDRIKVSLWKFFSLFIWHL